MRRTALLLVGLLLVLSIAPSAQAHFGQADEDGTCPTSGNHVHIDTGPIWDSCFSIDDDQKVCVAGKCVVINESILLL